MKVKYLLLTSLILSSVTACNDDDDDNDSPQAVTIDFRASVNGSPFVCGQTYPKVGTSNGATENSYKIDDFRLFIQDIYLSKGEGSQVALTLNQDDTWQYKTMALLDFENGCLNGTTETNTQIHGQLPAGERLNDYTGLCFKVGLPFEENHADPGQAPSPLNASGMLWSWTTGRKFLRIDGTGDPGGLNQSFHLHLGSTGCRDSSGTGGTPDGPCIYTNQPEICLPYKAHQQVVVADIGHVLAQSNVAVNTPDTAAGCMSGRSDPECIPIFPRLGLDFIYQQTGASESVTYPKATQVFFHTEAK